MTKVSPPIKNKDSHRRPGRDALDRPLMKRFYETVTIQERQGAHHIEIDGKPVRTPAHGVLALPTRVLALRICQEWHEQEEWIDPLSMPLTQLANTALDRVYSHMDEVRAAISAYAGADLLCYRADEPQALAEAQRALWDPVLAWLEATYGARFDHGAGVMHLDQTAESIACIDRHLQSYDAFELTPLHVMTTLTGSAFLALAIAEGHLSTLQAWTAAHIDEDWQIARWGRDDEARRRRAQRFGEMRAAAEFLFKSRC